MILRCLIWVVALGNLCALLSPAPAGAAVRVIEDEVIFTLRAPEANTVFLVGDFNNWNPNWEKMVKEGDVFEWSLFLVAGDYRYKFVVDGKWINDPDNPPEDPQRGSPLLLVETEAGLRIKEVDAEGRPLSASFDPSIRYIGRFTYHDDEFEVDQIVDINMEVKDKRYFSTATLQTRDDSWEFSPLQADIFFNRGRFDATIWKCNLTAFENDTVWTSSDPFALIGPRGAYAHNPGFGKRGVALDIPLSGSLAFRALFADKLNGDSFASVLDADGIRIHAGDSAREDSIGYAYRLGEDGSDVWGVEALLRMGDYQAGIVRRTDRGFHSGRLNTMQPLDSSFENTAYRTDEQWGGTAAWIGGKIFGPLKGKIAYGQGRAHLNRRRRYSVIAEDPLLIDVGRAAQPWDSDQKIQQSRRVLASLAYRRSSLRCGLQVDFASYEFEADLFEESEAKVLRSQLDAAYQRDAWSASLHVEYVDQDYGRTPLSFHIDSPERNFWLRGGDRFLPETIVNLDAESFSLLRLTFSNGAHMLVPGDGGENHRLRLEVEAGLNAGGMMESFDYGYTRLSIERYLYERLYAQLNARGSVYNKSEWGESMAFLAKYIEAGYRSAMMEISLGFGFDPVALDPVRNEYFAVGRSEYVRGAVGSMFTRGTAGDIGARLFDLEHALETDRTLKLECILHF